MLEIRSPAVARVLDYAAKIGVRPEYHLARWVECTALVRRGHNDSHNQGAVKKVEIVREGDAVVGVKAYV